MTGVGVSDTWLAFCEAVLQIAGGESVHDVRERGLCKQPSMLDHMRQQSGSYSPFNVFRMDYGPFRFRRGQSRCDDLFFSKKTQVDSRVLGFQGTALNLPSALLPVLQRTRDR
jgi:hypothetical protein